MKYLFTIIIVSLSFPLLAQDDLMNMLEEEVSSEAVPEKVTATFKDTRLILANTIETTKKKTLAFNITHRFGDMKLSESQGNHTMWGLDNASNIRFSFDYGVTDKLSIGIGRSKVQEHIDGNLKYRFLEQKEKGMPISVAYFANAAISPTANVPQDEFANRWSFTHQLIIASKLSKGVSLELLPTLVHRNYVDQRIAHPKNGSFDENDLFALGFAGRFKVTKRMAFVIDYFLPFSDFRDTDNGFYNPLAVGIEIETGGHVFHVNVSNSAGIIENDFITGTTDNWSDGEYKLGFNISRVFSF